MRKEITYVTESDDMLRRFITLEELIDFIEVIRVDCAHRDPRDVQLRLTSVPLEVVVIEPRP